MAAYQIQLGARGVVGEMGVVSFLEKRLPKVGTVRLESDFRGLYETDRWILFPVDEYCRNGNDRSLNICVTVEFVRILPWDGVERNKLPGWRLVMPAFLSGLIG